jgi:hypothetical protein
MSRSSTFAVDWEPCTAYQIGQYCVVSGFSRPELNGKWKVISAGTSGPNRSEFNGGTLAMEKI